MEKNASKVRESCQSEKVGSDNLNVKKLFMKKKVSIYLVFSSTLLKLQYITYFNRPRQSIWTTYTRRIYQKSTK